jgi:hypothetical protein
VDARKSKRDHPRYCKPLEMQDSEEDQQRDQQTDRKKAAKKANREPLQAAHWSQAVHPKGSAIDEARHDPGTEHRCKGRQSVHEDGAG